MGTLFEASAPSEQQKEAKTTPPAKSESEIEQYIKDNPGYVIEQYKLLFNGFIFERAFNVIYGTQIELLEHLLRKGDGGGKYINLVGFYNEYIKRLGTPTYQIANYFGFLKEFRFIEYTGEGSELSVKITPSGINFLSYLKATYPTTYKLKPY